ncbi:alpha/beta hydrolase [Cellvibrio sp. OA-2007]|uniref:alpha/beta hydrolase n=1 Tax=Cellvibrio sp. OA-2007 TaxID=529823 RepID=UPI0007844952|nr:alpha/beta hydrolase [Cellvibrio sp. OA-2007]
MEYLPCVEVLSQSHLPVVASVIWLHGLGADGNDFAPLVPELRLPKDLSVRFIFPHAPQIPVTINAGYVMPAWYDILEMNLERKVDETQLVASAEAVQSLIEREISRGVASENIILVGFSQGGAVAYHAGLTYAKPLAGLLILSSYFATHASASIDPANQHTPILIQHGSRDPVVSETLGQRAYRLLQDRGCNVNYESYPMEHTVCMEQVASMSKWIQAVLLK